MIDIEEYLVKKIAERCKKLRSDLDIPMEKISDRSTVSKIENMKVPESGNFITDTVVEDYVNLFGKSFKEIIFGNDKEIEETLEWLFGRMFRLIQLKNLDTDIDLYANKDTVDVEIQKAVISLAKTFAEYNLKRRNFLKTNDNYMDNLDKFLDGMFWVDGELINLARIYRTEPVNEATVIDLFDMENKMWLICKKQFINSFKTEVIDEIIRNFKFSTINSISNKWILNNFNKIIVPSVVEKLKSISIFKIGFMVENLIEEFLNEDLTVSFQKSVPLQKTRPKSYRIKFNTDNLRNSLGNDEKPIKIINEIFHSLNKNDESFEKYSHYGITVEKATEVNKIEEIEIEEILDRVANNKRNEKSLNDPIVIEQSPIFSSSDFDSIEDMERAFDEWYENKHFKNQNIPGYLTNNSQILNSLQNRMNRKTYELIDEYIDIQNNLLKLLTDEDLMKFSI